MFLYLSHHKRSLIALHTHTHLRVPVTVEDDDCIGSGEIDAKTAGTCRQKEAEVSRARRIEVIKCLFAQIGTHGAVQSL